MVLLPRGNICRRGYVLRIKCSKHTNIHAPSRKKPIPINHPLRWGSSLGLRPSQVRPKNQQMKDWDGTNFLKQTGPGLFLSNLRALKIRQLQRGLLLLLRPSPRVALIICRSSIPWRYLTGRSRKKDRSGDDSLIINLIEGWQTWLISGVVVVSRLGIAGWLKQIWIKLYYRWVLYGIITSRGEINGLRAISCWCLYREWWCWQTCDHQFKNMHKWQTDTNLKSHIIS